MFAIFETGGKQYKVQKGDVIYAEKLEGAEGSNIVFDKVLMVDAKTGAPYINGATVTCKIEKHGKQDKIVIIKHKRYSRLLKRQGHRQPYTKLTVVDIKA